MKRHIWTIAIVCVFLASGVFGIIKKQTYTDIVSESNYLDKLRVAVLPEKFVISGCEGIEDALHKIPIILKVKVTENIEHMFGTDRQKVEVKKVFKGNNIEEGTEIYLYSNHWGLSLEVEPQSIERGFVNIMETGDEYLVFLNESVMKVYGDIPLYKLCDETIIVPVFNYEDKATKIVETGNEHTYVSYADVKENEFFCDTVVGHETWKNLKKKLFAVYN